MVLLTSAQGGGVRATDSKEEDTNTTSERTANRPCDKRQKQLTRKEPLRESVTSCSDIAKSGTEKKKLSVNLQFG